MFKIAMMILILLLVSMNAVEEMMHEYLAFLLQGFSCSTPRLRSGGFRPSAPDLAWL